MLCHLCPTVALGSLIIREHSIKWHRRKLRSLSYVLHRMRIHDDGCIRMFEASPSHIKIVLACIVSAVFFQAGVGCSPASC